MTQVTKNRNKQSMSGWTELQFDDDIYVPDEAEPEERQLAGDVVAKLAQLYQDNPKLLWVLFERIIDPNISYRAMERRLGVKKSRIRSLVLELEQRYPGLAGFVHHAKRAYKR